jgi:long-chain acyl-CoA synthetase
LKITGRVKEIFKTSKGKYVAPAPIENVVVNHPRVEMACVSGAGKPQPYALVMLSEDAFDQCRNGGRAEIERELSEHLDRINAGLDSVEKLSFLAVVGDQWQAENGFLTPTLKIKRAEIESAYRGQAEAGYAARRKVVWLEPTT